MPLTSNVLDDFTENISANYLMYSGTQAGYFNLKTAPS